MRTRTIGLGIGSETDVIRFATVPPGTGWQPGEIPSWCSSEGNTISYEEPGEVMDDEESPRPPTGFKPCRHDKWAFNWKVPRRDIFIGDLSHNGAGTMLTSYEAGRANILYGRNFAISRSLVRLDTEFSEADKFGLGNIWQQMAPKIKSDLDLLVFLAELDEIPGLLKSLGSKALHLAHGPTIAKKAKLSVRLDKNLTQVANNWLEYNFALAPLVSDLISIVNSVLNINKKLANLRAYEGKLLKSHGGFTSPPHYTDDVVLRSSKCELASKCGENCPFKAAHDSESPLLRTGEAVVIRPIVTFGAKVSLTVMYRYTLPEWVHSFEGKMIGWLSGLGIKPGLDTIWELIPASFIVDWFFPVGSLLSKYKYDPYPVKTEILDVCASRKVSQIVDVWWKPLCKAMPPRIILTAQRDYFQRSVGLDLLVGTPSFRWPSWFQLSLGAALFKTKRKGKH